MQVTPINNNVNHQGINNKKKDKKIKAGVIAASALGVGAALAHVAKRQGFSLSPSAIKKLRLKIGQFLVCIIKINQVKKFWNLMILLTLLNWLQLLL